MIDCSVMPFIPSGNTNAPAMAVADRAVSIIHKPGPGEMTMHEFERTSPLVERDHRHAWPAHRAWRTCTEHLASDRK